MDQLEREELNQLEREEPLLLEREEPLLLEPLLPMNLPVTRSHLACYICTCSLIFLHLILMAVLVGTLTAIAPEVKTTLADVKIMIPQMHKTLSELGMMIPEIKNGMYALNQLCHASPDCQI